MRLLPRALAANVVKLALRERVLSGYPIDKPCDIYRLVAEHVTLQFIDVPTLEGMYLEDADLRRICVCAVRPSGRQRLTSAHEFGHLLMGHGTRLDLIEEARNQADENSIEETLANVFAYHILMPARAVHTGFTLRHLDPKRPTPREVYAVANWLGVGYTTLVQHMRFSLELLTSDLQAKLLRKNLKSLKSAIVGRETAHDVFELDALWNDCTLHTEIGDYVLGVGTGEYRILSPAGPGVHRVSACGSSKVRLESGATLQVHAARSNYVGFYDYRYLEEAN
jgi:Zn-dependent peptidase ImmA (M78 family)